MVLHYVYVNSSSFFPLDELLSVEIHALLFLAVEKQY